jgi:hypothetical protein
MLSEALALYSKHFSTLILTAALALVPASVVTAGAVVFGLSGMGAGGVAEARTKTERVQKEQRDLQEKPPPTQEERDLRVQQIGRDALEGKAGVDWGLFRTLLPLTYVVLIAVAVLVLGLSLAHAALVPLVLDLEAGTPTGPARAWAVVGSRIFALLRTGVLGGLLAALGAIFCVLPGIAVAAGFSFAIPATLSEGLAGRAALERSWHLMRGHWAPVLGMWLLIAIFTVAGSALSLVAPPGYVRVGIAALFRVFTYPLPLVGLVLLYTRARRREGAAAAAA